MTATERRNASDLVVTTVLFLFFLQLVTDFIETVYAFGLLGTSIPPEIASVLLFLAPALLLLFPQTRKLRPSATFGLVLLLTRLAALALDTRGRMLVSGLGVAAGLIWLPSLLWRLGQTDADPLRRRLGPSLMTAVMLLMLFRAAGSGVDLSGRMPSALVNWVLFPVAGFLLLRRQPRDRAAESAPTRRHAPSFGRLLALVMGLISVLMLLHFAFTAPNVIARWTGAGYSAVVVTLVAGLGLFVGLSFFRIGPQIGMSRGVLYGLNALFVLALVVTIRTHQLRFPADPGGYPFYAPDVTAAQHVALFIMLLLFPIVFVDFALYVREIATAQPSLRALGGAFTVGALVWVGMIFAHVFTTVYDYIPVIGPAFRDRFWVVYLVAGLGLVLPLLAVRRVSLSWEVSPAWAGTVVFVGVLAAVSVFLTMARPDTATPQPTLTMVTYNIQQGYGADGQRRLEDQLALLREADPDVIGLQESDTNRVAGGNADLVRAFADALDMHTYYGPTTVAGTFGIALLSKYPIQEPRTFYMYSEGEQTATIEAQITVGAVTYNVFVTHLGNGGPVVQQAAILDIVAGRENVILIGDFNFRPDTEPYALTTARLKDAWLQRWPGGTDDRGVQPPKRIDHIFISPELAVEDVRYIESPASDHPAVRAIVRP